MDLPANMDNDQQLRVIRLSAWSLIIKNCNATLLEEQMEVGWGTLTFGFKEQKLSQQEVLQRLTKSNIGHGMVSTQFNFTYKIMI